MNPKRSPAQVGAAVAGFFMMAISTPCVLAMLNDLFIVGTDNTTGALIVGTFMAFVGLAGLAMMVFGLKKPVAVIDTSTGQQQQQSPPSTLRQAMNASDFDAGVVSQALEREVLSLARNHGGRLTVADMAVDSDLSIEESKRLMDYMVSCDVAQTHLSDGGNIVYVFPGFSTNKHTAVNPLDDLAMFDKELAATAGDDEVVFERGMDGHVFESPAEADEAEEEVAEEVQQSSSEKW